ncbi:hypothetical protein F5X68DRAFT_232982 [Plectosphaerella plurivora]|uniref:DUF3824 domain-containing protein n=1 Tax=Plectosphaerella plurivora TaxID=936078 RepID=A0A9P8V9A4_9PEZI|nr:hypothetical protein F5X68DRAFT_232982 [Plectosphaerella plurivora]
MSYDYDHDPRERRRYTREEVRVEREPRYADDSYLRPHHAGELVPRRREDSELSVEEIRRDFPPPGYRDVRRTRSAEPGYDDYRYDDRYGRDDRRSKGTSSRSYYEEEEKSSRKRVLKNQEKIIAAVAGAALAFGGKEIYDRYDAKEGGTPVERNYLHSAALGAAGALAGYSGAELYNKHATKEEKHTQAMVHRGRDGELIIEPEEDKKSKNFLEGALAATGLGAAVKAFTGGGSDDKKDDRSRAGSPGRDGARSQSRARGPGGANPGNENMQKMQKAAMASLIAGATEAFRVAKEPGGWKGEKTKRVFTAAAGAAAVDSAQDRDGGSKMGLAQSVIGGLLGNRIINGSKSNIEEDKATGRSRSRSRARSKSRSGDGGGNGVSGLAALATAGLGALGAKKAIDHVRDKRDDSRGRSADSRDSRDGDRRQRSRSRSVVDGARKRLARLGIGNGPADDRDRDSRRDDSDYDDRGSRRGGGRYDDHYDDRDRDRDDRGYGRTRDPRDSRDPYYDDDRSATSGRRRDRSRSRSRSKRRARSRSSAGSQSDLGDSDDDLKTSRRMRGKQILTTGLAAVATIHAAHGVYQSMEARKSRQKAVKEGRLSPEEAKKLKAKAMLQDAAQIGLAGLGIKGAVSQMKSAHDKQAECKDWEHQRALRHQKRLERQERSLDGRQPRSRADDWYTPASPREQRYDDRYDNGPRYLDANPYASGLPAPPVGYDDRHGRR